MDTNKKNNFNHDVEPKIKIKTITHNKIRSKNQDTQMEEKFDALPAGSSSTYSPLLASSQEESDSVQRQIPQFDTRKLHSVAVCSHKLPEDCCTKRQRKSKTGDQRSINIEKNKYEGESSTAHKQPNSLLLQNQSYIKFHNLKTTQEIRLRSGNDIPLERNISENYTGASYLKNTNSGEDPENFFVIKNIESISPPHLYTDFNKIESNLIERPPSRKDMTSGFRVSSKESSQVFNSAFIKPKENLCSDILSDLLLKDDNRYNFKYRSSLDITNKFFKLRLGSANTETSKYCNVKPSSASSQLQPIHESTSEESYQLHTSKIKFQPFLNQAPSKPTNTTSQKKLWKSKIPRLMKQKKPNKKSEE